jgi:hypothetical protein
MRFWASEGDEATIFLCYAAYPDVAYKKEARWQVAHNGDAF